MTILSFEGVSLRKNGQTLLQDIDWHIQPGEDWGILGLNGAGKSLLLQMIAGNLWPSTGKLMVLGEVFGQTNLPDLTRRIGWVAAALQNKFYPQDLAEEIVLSGKFASIGLWQSYQASELTAAKDLLAALGGSELIGKPYAVLSQGEKQLVLIARALLPQPELLILDEPCTGLDLFAREELLQRIARIKTHPDAPTVLFVTHHTEELLPFVNRLLMLRQGRIYQQGLPQDLLTAPNLTEFYQKPIRLMAYRQDRIIVYPR